MPKSDARDPRKDPKAGDVVLPFGNTGGKWGEVLYHPLTVEARIGSLIAFTEAGHPSKVVWLLITDWCKAFDPITGWEVIHAAD